MLRIEELVEGNDLTSIVFKDPLCKTGQLTSDYILSTSNLSLLNQDAITRVINPLLQFTDCKIRIKDFNKLQFNFIFLLKEPTLRGILRTLEKPEYSKSDLKVGVDRAVIEKYAAEIEESNMHKVKEFVLKNPKLSTDDLMRLIETGFGKVKPFSLLKIEDTLAETMNKYFPDWRNYFRAIFNATRVFIEQNQAEKNRKSEIIRDFVEKNKLYYVGGEFGIPLLSGLRSALIFDLKQYGENVITKEDIDRFLLDKENFMVVSVAVVRKKGPVYSTFDGNSYKFDIANGESVDITENTESSFSLTDRKIDYFREKIRTMISYLVKVEIKKKLESLDGIYILYLRKKDQIIESAFADGGIFQLKLLQEILENNPDDRAYRTYNQALIEMIRALESTNVQELLLSFVKRNSKKQGFFSKVFSALFSQKNVEDMESSLEAEKTKINAINKSIRGDERGQAGRSQEAPVQFAINIIRTSNKDKGKLKEIFMADVDNHVRVNRILRYYDEIGATNKAMIEKNPKFQSEFLKEIINFMKNG